MPRYWCDKFNRPANVPSRVCGECGRLVIVVSKGQRWACPVHGWMTNPQVCPCDGCQKSYEVLQRSKAKTRPWKIKGRYLENPRRPQDLEKKQRRLEWLVELFGRPQHYCPKCRKRGRCTEEIHTKPDCGEVFKMKNPFIPCPINESFDKGQPLDKNLLRRACGQFWPSNPFTKDEELKEHIFYFHDAFRLPVLMKEVKPRMAPERHKCAYIDHYCIYCKHRWRTSMKSRGLAMRPVWRGAKHLGTTTNPFPPKPRAPKPEPSVRTISQPNGISKWLNTAFWRPFTWKLPTRRFLTWPLPLHKSGLSLIIYGEKKII